MNSQRIFSFHENSTRKRDARLNVQHGTPRLKIPFPNLSPISILPKTEVRLRAILIVGMMVLAGPALAQSGKNAAIKAVAEITAAAPFCGFDVQRDAVEKYLAERGVSRAKAPDAEELERAFNMASSGWRVTSSVYGKGKPQFDAACQQSIDAFGPAGTIRAGLVKLR